MRSRLVNIKSPESFRSLAFFFFPNDESFFNKSQGINMGPGPGLVTSPSFFSGVEGSALDQTTKAPWSENLQIFLGLDTNWFF